MKILWLNSEVIPEAFDLSEEYQKTFREAEHCRIDVDNVLDLVSSLDKDPTNYMVMDLRESEANNSMLEILTTKDYDIRDYAKETILICNNDNDEVPPKVLYIHLNSESISDLAVH